MSSVPFLCQGEGQGEAMRLVCNFLILCLVLNSCATVLHRELVSSDDVVNLDKKSPFLKAHMLNGEVYLLSKWEVDSENKTILGEGSLLNINREVVQTGALEVSIDSVALFETNVVKTSPSIAAMAVITGVSVAVTAICIANPKACFGSCPTFYASDGENLTLQAEGFSSSIAPFLEARDIDALYRVRPEDGALTIAMKNEALETHVVRYVHVLAVPKPEDGRAFVTADGTFWQASDVVSPRRALCPEGECLEALTAFDTIERYSTTDSTNLAEKEVLDFEFSNLPEGNVGLVIAARQSLLTTYLLYQTLAHMGRSAGAWLAYLERHSRKARSSFQKMNRVLGGIEVLIQNDAGAWISAGEIQEVGPLATDVHLLSLPKSTASPAKIRLRLTRGLWRLDYVSLASLVKPVEPTRLYPSTVSHSASSDEHVRELLTNRHDSQRYEFFLESRGYYLEWIRQEWLKEENLSRAALLFSDPETALRTLAPAFKKIEPDMEKLFWRSRYAK
jgi:hypothetical protein